LEYAESRERAAEYAESALTMMRDKHIPANPNNFAVWFHYFSGAIPDLKKALDIVLDSDEEFTAERNSDIFSQFFTLDKENDAFFDTAKRVEEKLADAIGHMAQAGDGAAEYGEALETFTGEIEGAGGPEGVKTLIAAIQTTTREMEEKNRHLEQKLQASSSEISQLKGNLEDMRQEAMTDALTSIPNRKLFDIQLRREAVDAMEGGDDLCLLMIDIDHFKKFNDSYGHQVGDQVLKLLGATLTSCVKGQDTAARYGGEEFAVILPHTNLDDAVRVAEGICKQVGEKKVMNRKTGEDLGQITVSIGAGAFNFGEPLSQFISRADGALYEAKHQGRNRVVSEAELKDKALAFSH